MVHHLPTSSLDKAKDPSLKMHRSQEETGIIETTEKIAETVGLGIAWNVEIAATAEAKRETTKINPQDNSTSTQILTIGFTT